MARVPFEYANRCVSVPIAFVAANFSLLPLREVCSARNSSSPWLGVTVGIAVCDATLRRDADHPLTIHADTNEKSFATDNSDEFYNVTQQNR
jgi:hypothetical protein